MDTSPDDSLQKTQNPHPVEPGSPSTPTKGTSAKAEMLSVKSNLSTNSSSGKDGSLVEQLKDRWIALAHMFHFFLSKII